ncbi:5-methylcytosine-specific restriction endonuclease McrA [Sphingomonas sp. BE123]|uniref:HNH endonuclease n=1 Tax=Sphingomonas sp. BE123 TaxID=2817842 RepID=UPI002867AF59|nr:HNH endonuclease [Sphingomonas sp. BE123]MDR6851083.1 5-methylcytosine-specific restriction endonuclease McrA [Sphingomonas sp. BE123]
MGKLKTLPSMLTTLPPALAYMDAPNRSAEANRATFAPWRKWYSTARWQKLRMKVLTRDLFTCQRPGCGRMEPDTSQLVADHKLPHRGDEQLFWNEDNIETLCKPCHDRDKQREERAARR